MVEVKRIVDGEVKQTLCCCAAPGRTAVDCAIQSHSKSRCRCQCHVGKAGPGEKQ